MAVATVDERNQACLDAALEYQQPHNAAARR